MDADAVLAHRIAQRALDYAHGIDDGRLDEWPGFFTDPCFYAIVPRDNFEADLPLAVMRFESRGMLQDRVTATLKAAVFAPRYVRHVLGGVRLVARDGATTQTETNLAVYQTGADGDTLLLLSGQYRDRWIDDGGTLRLRERVVVYDTLRLPDTIVYPI
jgi:3-phenylpropionate/cinnamic acid dioxygenase small subunit